MTKREKNRLDRLVDQAFCIHGNRVQFNIMDLGKIHAETLAAVVGGGDVNEAMIAAVAKYRQ